MKTRQYLFTFYSCFSNIKNDDVRHRGMELQQKNKFRSLNVINGKTTTCISKDVLRHCHYRSGTKLDQWVVYVRIIHVVAILVKINCIFLGILKHTRYTRVFNFKYYLIIGSCNHYIIINYLDDGKYEVDHEHINITILDANFINMLLMIKEILMLLILTTLNATVTILSYFPHIHTPFNRNWI